MKKQNAIKITQENGKISIYRNGECEHQIFCNRVVERIKQGDLSEIGLANYFAEVINDCLNCKTAVSVVEDLNDTKPYRGTYFEDIDQFIE